MKNDSHRKDAKDAEKIMKIESNRKDAKDAKKNKRSFWITPCVLCAFAVNDFKYLRYLQGAPRAPGLYRRDAEDTGKIMKIESYRKDAKKNK